MFDFVFVEPACTEGDYCYFAKEQKPTYDCCSLTDANKWCVDTGEKNPDVDGNIWKCKKSKSVCGGTSYKNWNRNQVHPSCGFNIVIPGFGKQKVSLVFFESLGIFFH